MTAKMMLSMTMLTPGMLVNATITEVCLCLKCVTEVETKVKKVFHSIDSVPQC